MSNLPKGTPCYALLWEGVIGAFYEIDAELNITKIADVMPEPGHRYAMLYALADPTFDKLTAEFPGYPMLENLWRSLRSRKEVNRRARRR